MAGLLVPFRIQNKGWMVVALCFLLEIAAFGFRIGILGGAALLLCLLLHEVGHILGAVALKVPVREFGISVHGAYTIRAHGLRGRDDALISLAGPLTNLALAFPSLFLPHIGIQIACCNIALCVLNLLPIPSSDGLRIARSLWGPEWPSNAISE
jgi:Zn-dependent protease